MIGPSDSRDRKERHLRALFRAHAPGSSINCHGKFVIDFDQQNEQLRIVRAEYERLFGEPTRGGALESILCNVWIEARQLAGERYCYTCQRWIGPDEDDGRGCHPRSD